MIDKSHTKKDIIEIVETFDFKIEDYSDMTKNYLFKVVETYIDSLESFKGNAHYKDLDSLKEYLRKPNQNRIKIADRDKYIDIAKHIIFYCKNGYILSYTKYLTEDDLIRDIQMICSFCNLPTCLRAVNLINSSGKFKQKFEPITSGKTKVLLRKREEQRLKTLNIMKTRTIDDNGGIPFRITFD
jgi:hypothetical protein